MHQVQAQKIKPPITSDRWLKVSLETTFRKLLLLHIEGFHLQGTVGVSCPVAGPVWVTPDAGCNIDEKFNRSKSFFIIRR